MSRRTAFVLRHTRLRPVAGLEHLRLHLADEVLPLWGETQRETGDPDAPLPYWAFAWGGGLALATYLRDHPDDVRGQRVYDLASGSGLCAIAALRAGASSATAAEIDAFAAAAIALNARANGCRVDVLLRDVLDDEPPDTDVILVGDAWYEAELARRVWAWLRRAADSGLRILVGDPGRRYLPADGLRELARYDVRTTTELEDLALKSARVFTMAAVRPAEGLPPGVSGPSAATPT
jgi:predicted nicotinamide N-methyase